MLQIHSINWKGGQYLLGFEICPPWGSNFCVQLPGITSKTLILINLYLINSVKYIISNVVKLILLQQLLTKLVRNLNVEFGK